MQQQENALRANKSSIKTPEQTHSHTLLQTGNNFEIASKYRNCWPNKSET